MMSRFAAAAAVVLILVVGTVAFGPLVNNLGPGASQSPSEPPTSPAQTAAAGAALNAYRAARNQICMTAVQAFSSADLVGLYDDTIPAERRTIVNANAQEVADAVAASALALAELEPPSDIAVAHAADVAHAQNLAAIFAVSSQFLLDGRISDAEAMEFAMDAARALRLPFETQYSLFNCP